jgi:hypothetical protein
MRAERGGGPPFLPALGLRRAWDAGEESEALAPSRLMLGKALQDAFPDMLGEAGRHTRIASASAGRGMPARNLGHDGIRVCLRACSGGSSERVGALPQAAPLGHVSEHLRESPSVSERLRASPSVSDSKTPSVSEGKSRIKSVECLRASQSVSEMHLPAPE